MPVIERALAELQKQRATLSDPALQLCATGYRCVLHPYRVHALP